MIFDNCSGRTTMAINCPNYGNGIRDVMMLTLAMTMVITMIMMIKVMLLLVVGPARRQMMTDANENEYVDDYGGRSAGGYKIMFGDDDDHDNCLGLPLCRSSAPSAL